MCWRVPVPAAGAHPAAPLHVTVVCEKTGRDGNPPLVTARAPPARAKSKPRAKHRMRRMVAFLSDVERGISKNVNSRHATAGCNFNPRRHILKADVFARVADLHCFDIDRRGGL